jgi:anti-sigma factor RsiW
MSEFTHDHEQCLDLFARMSEYLDGELDETLCQSMDRHLADCPACRVCLATLKRTVALCRASGDAAVLPEKMVQRLRAICPEFNPR